MTSLQSHPATTFLSRYLPLILWLAFISLASSDKFSAANTSRIIGPLVLWLFPNTSAETMNIVHLVTRKLAHFTEYGILAFLSARAFRTSPRTTLNRHWLVISFVIIAVYSLIDEYHQSFVPSRTPSIFDSFIDMAGGLAVLLVIYWRGSKLIHASNSAN